MALEPRNIQVIHDKLFVKFGMFISYNLRASPYHAMVQHLIYDNYFFITFIMTYFKYQYLISNKVPIKNKYLSCFKLVLVVIPIVFTKFKFV